eukprot:Hpha_TRINITY_DN19145_c0_g1::TRINITY_DN19145_c0_g1_i1::g.94745::m.94745
MMDPGGGHDAVLGVQGREAFWEIGELLGEGPLAGSSDLAFSQARVPNQGVEGVLSLVTRTAAVPIDWVRGDDDRLRALKQSVEQGTRLSEEEEAEMVSLNARYEDFVTAGVQALDWALHAPREVFLSWLPLGLAWAVNPGLVPPRCRDKITALAANAQGSGMQSGASSPASAGSPTGPGSPLDASLQDGASFGPDGTPPQAWRLARLLPAAQLHRVKVANARRRLGQRPKLLSFAYRTRDGEVLHGPYEVPSGPAAELVGELRKHLPLLPVNEEQDGSSPGETGEGSVLGKSFKAAMGKLAETKKRAQSRTWFGGGAAAADAAE